MDEQTRADQLMDENFATIAAGCDLAIQQVTGEKWGVVLLVVPLNRVGSMRATSLNANSGHMAAHMRTLADQFENEAMRTMGNIARFRKKP